MGSKQTLETTGNDQKLVVKKVRFKDKCPTTKDGTKGKQKVPVYLKKPVAE